MLIGRRALRYPHSCWTGGVIPVWRCSRDGRFSAGKSTGRCCVAVPFGVILRRVVIGAGCRLVRSVLFLFQLLYGSNGRPTPTAVGSASSNQTLWRRDEEPRQVIWRGLSRLWRLPFRELLAIPFRVTLT